MSVIDGMVSQIMTEAHAAMARLGTEDLVGIAVVGRGIGFKPRAECLCAPYSTARVADVLSTPAPHGQIHVVVLEGNGITAYTVEYDPPGEDPYTN